jgi:hypothetical protein
LQETFDEGRTEVLRGGPNTMTPADLRDRIARSSDPENAMRRQGVRTELDRMTTNQRRNPAATVDRVTARDWNNRKIAEMVGPERAQRLARDLDREATFTETSNLAEAGRGSRTAPLTEVSRRMWNHNASPSDFANTASLTTAGGIAGGYVGAAAGFGAGIANALRKSVTSALSGKASPEVIQRTADRLTRTGHTRQHIVQALMDSAAALPRRSQTANNITRLISVLLLPESGRLGYESQQRFLPAYRAGR